MYLFQYLFKLYKTQMGTNLFHAAVDIEDSYPLHTKETRSVNLLHNQHIFLWHCRIPTATVHHWKLHIGIMSILILVTMKYLWFEPRESICAKPSKLGQEGGTKNAGLLTRSLLFKLLAPLVKRCLLLHQRPLYSITVIPHKCVIEENTRNGQDTTYLPDIIDKCPGEALCSISFSIESSAEKKWSTLQHQKDVCKTIPCQS